MTMRTCAVIATLALACSLGCEDGRLGGNDPVGQPDAAADAAADAALDVVPDLVPDAAPDALPEIPTDASGDAAPDLADVPSDVLTDAPAEALDPGTDAVARPFLSARKTKAAADLVSGDNAWAAAGRSFVIENSVARFVVQDKGAAVHLGVRGGSLIDADLARKPYEVGNDQFREMFPMVGMRVSTVESVEVFRDGSDGVEAIVRVTGLDAPSGVLPDVDPGTSPLGTTIITDYALRPDEPVLRIRTTVVNGPADPARTGVTAGDYLALGGSAFVFTPEGGFGATPTSVTTMIGAGRGAAYAYTPQSGMIEISGADSNGFLATLDSNMKVPAQGGRAMFERMLVLGTDVASVLDRVRVLRNQEARKVSGHVIESFGETAVPDASVTAFAAGFGDPTLGGHALSQARTGQGEDQGLFAMTLPPGRYDLVFTAPGRPRVVKAVDLTGGDAIQDAVLAPAGKFGLEAKEHDFEGNDLGFIPAKASLTCLPGTAAPWIELNERANRGLCGAFFNPTGKAMEFPLMPGRYRLTVSRGTEYEVVTDEEVVIEEGFTSWTNTSLYRSVRTPGFLAGDFHQHTLGSVDAAPTHEERIGENAAEGVEIAACTDHDMTTSYSKVIQALKMGNQVFGYDGDEVSITGQGHFNVFAPAGQVLLQDRTAGDLYPFVGASLYANREMDESLAAMQTVPGVQLVQLNHPRGDAAYLNWVGYDPTTNQSVVPGRTMYRDFDIIEVNDSIGNPADYLETSDPVILQLTKNSPGKIPVMRDWFAMLNAGYPIAAVANSDAHDRNDGVGYGRNLVRVGTDRPGDMTTADVTTALLAQRVSVSNGPFIRLLFEGRDRMGKEDLVVPTDKSVVVQVIVEAPTWVDVDALEVYANGRPLPVVAVGKELLQDETASPGQHMTVALPLSGGTLSESIRLDATLRLFPKKDTWYVVVVKGRGSLEPVGRGTPWAYTNPLYVDLDGDGFL